MAKFVVLQERTCGGCSVLAAQVEKLQGELGQALKDLRSLQSQQNKLLCVVNEMRLILLYLIILTWQLLYCHIDEFNYPTTSIKRIDEQINPMKYVIDDEICHYCVFFSPQYFPKRQAGTHQTLSHTSVMAHIHKPTKPPSQAPIIKLPVFLNRGF